MNLGAPRRAATTRFSSISTAQLADGARPDRRFLRGPGTGQGGTGSSLFAVTALSASDVWTVGHSQNGDGTITTLTEQFNGSTWSVVASPNPGLRGVDTLFDVAGAGGTQLFAIGSNEQSGQCCLRTLALRTASG